MMAKVAKILIILLPLLPHDGKSGKNPIIHPFATFGHTSPSPLYAHVHLDVFSPLIINNACEKA